MTALQIDLAVRAAIDLVRWELSMLDGTMILGPWCWRRRYHVGHVLSARKARPPPT